MIDSRSVVALVWKRMAGDWGTAGRIYEGAQGDLGVMAIFLILIMVLASQIHAYVKVSNWTP